MLNDSIVAYIRTYVPLGVGAAIAWAITNFGLIVPAETSDTLVIGITGLVVAIYYAAATALAKVHPIFGWLLGNPATPTYTE